MNLTTSALACELPANFHPPTNLQQAEHSPTIIVGRVARWSFKKARNQTWYDETNITVIPIIALKGAAPKSPFKIEGMLAQKEGYYPPQAAEPSNFGDFIRPHSDAFSGQCSRHNFVVGSLVVFFLEPFDGGWRPFSGAHTRWAEDVPFANAPWVRLVRIYIEASHLRQHNRISFLKRERDKLLAQHRRRWSRLMATDIQRQIDGRFFDFDRDGPMMQSSKK